MEPNNNSKMVITSFVVSYALSVVYNLSFGDYTGIIGYIFEYLPVLIGAVVIYRTIQMFTEPKPEPSDITQPDNPDNK